MADNTVIIRGSWGDLTVHKATGYIVDYDPCSTANPADPMAGYFHIVMVDPSTLIDDCVALHGECDILSVGYWDSQGRYEFPMRWEKRGFKWKPELPDSDESNWHGDWQQIEGLLPAPQPNHL